MKLVDLQRAVPPAVARTEIVGGETLVFSHDGRRLVISIDDSFRMVDALTGRTLETNYGGNSRPLHSPIRWTPNDEYLMCVSKRGGLQLWDWCANREARILLRDKRFFAFEFSADGRLLITSDGQIAELWDWPTLRFRNTLERSECQFVAISHDNRRAVTSKYDAANTISVWDVPTGQRISSWPARHGSIVIIALSLNGELLASGRWDNVIRIWEMPTGKLKHELRGHRS